MIDLVRLGDAADHGGKVVSASKTMLFDGLAVARKGDEVRCPRHAIPPPLIALSKATRAYRLRAFYYEQENECIDAENEVLRGDRQQAITFASEPLAVVSYAYLTGAGRCDVATIMAGDTAGQASDGQGVGRYAALALSSDDGDATRDSVCFKQLVCHGFGEKRSNSVVKG